MPGEAVIDASVAFKLIVEEEDSAIAAALIAALLDAGVTPIAPLFFPFEIANALHKRVRSGELTPTRAIDLFSELTTFGIELRSTDDLHERAIGIASRLEQGAAYDSHYLALALARDCEFWTSDRRFYRAARRLSDHARWLGDFDPEA